MKKFYYLLLFTVLLSTSGFGQAVDLTYYLPKDVTYNIDIPTPQSVLGFEVGEMHVNHDKLVQYMQRVAESSPRVQAMEYGRSHENRPLMLLFISSPENLENLEEIQANHLKLSDPEQSAGMDTENMPGIVWMGYSIHGNEASGSNAALITAYHLAAGDSEDIDDLLENNIVLLDPSYNPDGMHRFASWVNSHKSMSPNPDPNDWEHNEVWPGGRTNHYWFDLNRDWMMRQHPESKGRVAQYHNWKPLILTDHHEMGSNSSFFFQPGMPTRENPLIPERTYELTKTLATYHADALDEIQSLYFSEEGYDDYYIGKGASYPDFFGTVAVLFEQGSARGHAQDTENGLLTFPFAVKNQFTTSLSTLEGARNMRVSLLNNMRNFYQQAAEKAADDPVKGLVFGDPYDKVRTRHMVDLIAAHDIKVHKLARDVTAGGQSYSPEHSFVVPLDQPNYVMIKGLFERRTQFEDSLFYDVSSWNIPYAFNVPFAELEGRSYSAGLLGEEVEGYNAPEAELVGGASNYAYVFRWDNYNAGKAVNRMLEAGMNVKVFTRPFTDSEGRNFDYGTIMVPVELQRNMDDDEVYEMMQVIVNQDHVTVYNMTTGLTPQGLDLGSREVETLRKPRALMLVGDGVRAYDAGEVWHLFDQRLDMSLSLVNIDDFNDMDLTEYRTLIMVDGNYSDVSSKAVQAVKNWVNKGGLVIASKRAGRWLDNNGIMKLEFKSKEAIDVQRPYGKQRRDRGAQVIGGAIFQADLDLTHPLAYGFHRNNVSLFRNSTLFLEKSKNAYVHPIRYTENPLLSGYISEENTALLKNTPAVATGRIGRGNVIYFTDNHNFRAFWYGTNKFFMNALFFGHLIR